VALVGVFKFIAMKKYTVKIKSITPYMQHRMDDQKLEEWEKKHNLVMTNPNVCKEDSVRAEYHCYRNSKGKCYIPSEHIRGSLIAAGSMVKGKVGSTTKSMKSIVAAMFFIVPDEIEIENYDMIDKRSAVNRNIKARVITVRPKWSTLEANFDLHVDNDTIPIEMIKQIFEFAGNNIGIGSFRPTNNGMFGRFMIENIKEIL
jgi:hypothetical protein